MAIGRKTGGRQKGTPNKIPGFLKDDILEAAARAHPEGRVAYLTQQAQENPTAFLSLLGKVLPTQVTGANEGPIQVESTVNEAQTFARRMALLAARAQRA